MPNHLAERLAALPPNTWVLTETVWQARGLQALVAQQGHDSNIRIWERPFILTWDQAWPLLWDRLPLALPMRLSVLQERAVWRRVIQAAHPQDWLLDADRSARLAQQARSVLLQWQSPELDPFAGPLSEEAEHFLGWHGAYEDALEDADWVDRAALPDQLVALLQSFDSTIAQSLAAHLPPSIQTYAVDRRSPQRQRLLDALSAQSIAVESLPLWQVDDAAASGDGSAAQAICVDADAERLQAAHWLRSELERVVESSDEPTPQAAWRGRRWLWVVPDLAQTRAAIERILRSVFQPKQVVSLAPDAAPLWRFGVVQTLAEVQPVQAILHLLRLGQGSIQLNDFGLLLRSPWWIEEAERAAAIALDVRLRKQGEPTLTLKVALSLLDDCSMLQRTVAALLDGLAAIQGVQSTALWAEQFEQFARTHFWTPLLDRVGEDAEQLQRWSVARDAWNEALDQFAALQAVEPAPGYAYALSLLTRAIENVRMPEGVGEAPIWVCTPRDAVAVPANAVWVSGLREDRWSVSPRMHPMLPVAWARNLPIYRSDLALAEADQQLQQWVKMGAIFSWPQHEAETELAPVAAVAMLPLYSSIETKSLAQRLRGQARAEPRLDPAPALTQNRIAGGASAFQHQSLCPFRGFVRARLGVQALEEGHGGLDARERGTILHKALQSFWQRFPQAQRTQASLRSLSDAVLDERISQAVEVALQALQAQRGPTLSGRFMQHEQQRLRQALQKLVALDLNEGRSSFHVIEVEDRRQVSFAGLQFNIQRDRVEEVHDQQRIVMDYKTGSVSASEWYGDRPKNPQLPLYAVLEAREGHALAGVLFAQYREGDWKFSGELTESSLLPKEAMSKRKPIDFSEALPAWETALTQLAGELRDGVARVDPQSGACQFCGLQAACRIDPWQEVSEVDEGGV